MSPHSRGARDKVLEAEREVMRECMKEAIMARAFPVSFATGIVVSQLIRMEKIKASRWGGLHIVLGSSCLAYVVGKYSYIFGENCAKKFAEKVPESEISKKYEEKKNTSNEFSFGGFKISWGSSIDIESKLPNNYPSLHDKILPELDHLTEKENQILDDCRTASIWNYSFPLAIFCSSFIYSLMAYKFLNESRVSKSFPRTPKTLVGGILGYGVGQLVYVFSRDCPERFLQGAPQGEVAKLLRGDYHLSEQGEQAGDGLLEEGAPKADYIIPEETGGSISKLLKQQTAF